MKKLNLGFNCPIFYLKESAIEDLHPGIKYLRIFSAVFNKPKLPDGSFSFPDHKQIDALVNICLDYEIEVIYCPQITKDGRTMASEFGFMQMLIDRGVNIVAIQILGEMYLDKYRYGQLNKKAVIEQFTASDIAPTLKLWVPAIIDAFPDRKYLITVASHQNLPKDSYRIQYTQNCIDWVTKFDTEGKLEFCFHFYSGFKNKQDDEELSFTEIDVTEVVNQIRLKSNAPIHLCEGNHYRLDDSPEEMYRMGDYINHVHSVLSENAFIIMQVFQAPGYFSLYDGFGKTNVGDWYDKFLDDWEDDGYSENESPVLASTPIVKFSRWGKVAQHLVFSDGSILIHEKQGWWDFSWRPFDYTYIGQPKSNFIS